MMKKYYLTFALIGVIGILIAVGYTALNGKIFADVPASGDNPNVTIKPITLFSDEGGSPATEIDMTVARGAKESIELVLDNASSKAFSNLTVYKNDLISTDGSKISKDSIDERVVHVWQQRTIIPGVSFKKNTYKLENLEELLVKNDKEDFLSESIGVAQDTLLSSSGSKKAKVADSRLEPVSLKLDANSKRKFIFSITAPYDKVGSYEGDISFVDTANNTKVKTFKLKVSVLSVDLVSGAQENGKIFGCFVNDQIPQSGQATSGTYVDQQGFINRLKVAKEMGCDSLIMRFGKFTNINQMLEAVSSMGFAGPIILNYYYGKADGTIINSFVAGADAKNNALILEAADAKADFKKIVTGINSDKAITTKIMFYGLDEPNINSANSGNQDKFTAHKKKIENIVTLVEEIAGSDVDSNISSKVVSAANVYTSVQVNKLGGNYFSGVTIESTGEGGIAGNFSDRIAAVQSGQPQLGKETYYFQGWGENPTYMRSTSGFGLIKTGMSGFYMNPLWGYFNNKSRPIYLEDKTRPVDSTNVSPFMKQMMTFYPASDGLIPTIQSEGIREGILDSRYYLTYKQLAGTLNDHCLSTDWFKDAGSKIESSVNDYGWLEANQVTDPAKFVQTRDLIKEYFIQYATLCSSQTVKATKGFGVFSPVSTSNSSTFAKADMKIFSFNGAQNKWQIAPGAEIAVRPGNAYYVNNTVAQDKSFSIEPNLQSVENRTLVPGWNLLSSPYQAPLSKVNALIKDASKNCSKQVSLQALINLNYAHSGVFVIVDDKATDANKAFKLYGQGVDELQYIPANKGFWYYLFKLPSANDAKLKDFDCR
jgi:hypothetical protein